MDFDLQLGNVPSHDSFNRSGIASMGAIRVLISFRLTAHACDAQLAEARTDVAIHQDARLRVAQRTPGAMPAGLNDIVQSSESSNIVRIPILDLLSSPWSFAQKSQAGLDARIDQEATNRDSISHFLPSKPGDEMLKDHFQSDAMQRIF